MRRRKFIQEVALGVASVGLSSWPARADLKRVDLQPNLTGHETDWTFVGSKDWTQDNQGILYSPIWNECIARKGGNDLLKREDFAYPATEFMGDTDISVEFRTYWWSVDTVGVVFRSQDSVRYYYVEFGEPGTGDTYDVRVMRRDSSGYRHDLASMFVPHARRPDNWNQMLSSGNREEWAKVTPGWVKLRVQVQGSLIRVFVDGKQVLEIKDATYSSGRAGLLARGPIQFRNLRLSGKRATRSKPWMEAGDLPSYFNPWPDPAKHLGDNQSFPGVFRMANGDLGVWMGVTGSPYRPEDALLVWSRDNGKSWVDPTVLKKRPGMGQPNYFFGHKNARLSCLYLSNYDWEGKSRGAQVGFSHDGGKTWSNPEPLLVSGKPLSEYAENTRIGPYSPIMRLSDGTLLQFYYEVNLTADGRVAEDEHRRDRSLLIRSTDDGQTWEGPFYIAPDNYDSNECMAVELTDGTLVAFARTVKTPYMWKSTSMDKGKTWTKQVQSNLSGASPIMLRHSSGVLIMGSRNWGVSMTTSIDDGKTWSRPTLISILTGMMGMVEIDDGKVLIVYAEGYRTPSRIRAQFFRVHPDGTLAPA